MAQLQAELQMRRQVGGANDEISSPGFPSIGSEGIAQSKQPMVGFDSLLGNFVQEINNKQVASGDAITGLLGGGDVQLHQAMIAMEEASVSFQLMVEVRNKLLEGYQELLRMQV